MKTKLFILCLLLSHSLWGQDPWKIKATDLTPEHYYGVTVGNTIQMIFKRLQFIFTDFFYRAIFFKQHPSNYDLR